MNYPHWPSDEVRDLYLQEAGGHEALAISRHSRDLENLRREEAARAKKIADGFIVAPDGSWIHISDWKRHLKILSDRARLSPQWAP